MNTYPVSGLVMSTRDNSEQEHETNLLETNETNFAELVLCIHPETYITLESSTRPRSPVSASSATMVSNRSSDFYVLDDIGWIMDIPLIRERLQSFSDD